MVQSVLIPTSSTSSFQSSLRRPLSSQSSQRSRVASGIGRPGSRQNSRQLSSSKQRRPQTATNSRSKENVPLSLLNRDFVDHDYFPSKKPLPAAKDSEESSTRKWKLSDFVLGKQLGKGKFGVVYVAYEKKTKKTVALKILDKRRMKIDRCSSLVKREIKIQSQLVHPNVLKMYGYFTDSSKVYLILEYCPKGEVYRQLKRNKRFSEKRASRYIQHVAKALKYCHDKSVIHRDIKPENLLIGKCGDVKLCDFGWSIQAEDGQRRTTMCGTLDYLAPEMVEKRLHDSRLDLWCLGVLAYEFLCGKAPFHSRTNQETFRKISKVDLRFPSFVSDEAKSLIRQLLKRARNDRLSLDKVLQHPFIQRYVSDKGSDNESDSPDEEIRSSLSSNKSSTNTSKHKTRKTKLPRTSSTQSVQSARSVRSARSCTSKEPATRQRQQKPSNTTKPQAPKTSTLTSPRSLVSNSAEMRRAVQRKMEEIYKTSPSIGYEARQRVARSRFATAGVPA